MRVPTLRATPAVRNWTAVLVLSAAFHAAVLGAFALKLPSGLPVADGSATNLALIPAPILVRRTAARAAAPSPVTAPPRLVVVDVPPRYAGAPQPAATGEASDAVDLNGPVFADGMWPRPLVVRREPCDPDDPTPAGVACRRELLVIGPVSGG